ncbi:putative protein OS=Tsukamurella paurometabola (strain ATCC 8368 / DSM / CCUG 35730 /CIP 100753 / JCM 10117 / KCTC 9821 / NBRC 16120 / NCIMB 702349/ NCTC 13040) OX=521096 GN=Tpau_3976 PE=4 SV=1 [Tsukamurella paurometabola]|uniref:Uncharacterized protein n=1 Tax=Tsukamurella paurometabola (strain ATCC 8368 / DSM 20162 / CCUG 35730 / CIP 100753 / JCM 10117 / KCTC 9821 / NBRC 16120 / NCIMB 702349 / NCTC 13040) TaxID=521096 RepID=D5UMS3_TSUPD|nr:hypothetical protein [Tsukamurella paurometabola]ADG80547.1 hypothetical protein Tpau_3976 [Tsukamurella paurometabola DSM 20162]SUP40048.1 Uncharacterised protein [Tsukamurella paurometabola]
MFRPAHPAATARGVLVGGTSLAASLTAHTVAMAGAMGPSGPPSAGDPMPGHAMSGHTMSGHTMSGHTMSGHAMAAMPGHDMAAMTPDGAGAMAPSVPPFSILVLAAVCAAIGVLAARPRAAGPLATGAMVLFGQLGGHVALGLTMGHLAITPGMAAAHLLAAVVAGATIAGAEAALRLALATLRAVVAAWTRLPRTVVVRSWDFRPLPVRVQACNGALRAPPA